MSPLAAFIDGELSRRGWSTERAAAEATKRGHYLSGETVRKARRDLYKEPLPPATFDALAAAFGVKPERIQQLDLQRWKITPEDNDVESAVLGDDTITEHDKRVLLDLYKVMQEAAGISRSPASPDPERRKAP